MEKHKKNVGLFKTGCAISRSFVSLSLSRHTGISPHSALSPELSPWHAGRRRASRTGTCLCVPLLLDQYCLSCEGLVFAALQGNCHFIPSSNQTWLAGKSPLMDPFSLCYAHLWGISYCHVWLPKVAFEMSTWYYNFIRTWDTLNPNGLASGSSLEYS